MHLTRFLTLLLIFCFFCTPAFAKAPDSGLGDIGKLTAASNELNAINANVDKILTYQGQRKNPIGLVNHLEAFDGKVELITSKVDMILEKQLTEGSSPPPLDDLVAEVGRLAVKLADRCELGFEIIPDAPAVLDALAGVKFRARTLASLIEWHLAYTWEKFIPIRFVQVQNCFPWLSSCEPNLERESLQNAVDGMNETFRPAGARFWIRSIEQYYMYSLAHSSFPKDSLIEWWRAADELSQVFDIPDFTPPNPDQNAADWLIYASTLFSDPTELLVWVFANDSLTSRQIDGHSIATLPHQGRTLIISALNIYDPERPEYGQPELSPYHLAHETGHFFGLTHPWETPVGPHPVEDRRVDSADLWDLSFCFGDLGYPMYFSSRDDALALDCHLRTIEEHPCPCGEVNEEDECVCSVAPNCRVDNRYGADDSDMQCYVMRDYFNSGHGLLKGLSFDQGDPELPPDSFAWGLNVMGYYGRYNAHLWTPGRFSDAQLEIIKGHLFNSVPIEEDYSPYVGLDSQRDLLGAE